MSEIKEFNKAVEKVVERFSVVANAKELRKEIKKNLRPLFLKLIKEKNKCEK